jgi:2-polyprenyl-6-hydroxyphenyl methylase/3-demethylubiquinone-9 3-methyltransferase
LSVFIDALGRVVTPGGALALATLNRTLKSLVLAIIGAEYVLRWLPRGTHNWEKFVKPSEVSRHLRRCGFTITDVTGVTLDPMAFEWRTSRDTSVNYMMFANRTAAR